MTYEDKLSGITVADLIHTCALPHRQPLTMPLYSCFYHLRPRHHLGPPPYERVSVARYANFPTRSLALALAQMISLIQSDLDVRGNSSTFSAILFKLLSGGFTMSTT